MKMKLELPSESIKEDVPPPIARQDGSGDEDVDGDGGDDAAGNIIF